MSAKDIVLAAAGGGQTTTAIQYVGGKTVTITPSTSSNTTISLTDLTGSPDPTLQAGDIVIVSYVTGSSSPAGNPNVTSNTYTIIATLESNDTSSTNFYSSYKIMGATPDTSVTVTPTSATSRSGVVAIQAYRYVDEVFPLQAPANTVTITNTVRPTPPTITPWDADSVAVIVGAGAHTRGNVAYTTTGLTSFISSGSTDTSDDSSIGMGYRVIQSGSYSPNRFGFPQSDSSAFSSVALSVALKPKPDTVLPTFISYRSGRTADRSLTITAPTGIQSGDLLLLFVIDVTSSAQTFTPPSGFSLNSSITGGTSFPQSFIYKKTATSSEPASYTITKSSSSGSFSVLLFVFRNANTINTVGAGDLTTALSVTAPGITPTRGGTLLSVFANSGNKTVSSAPTGVTLLATTPVDSPYTVVYNTTVAPYFLTADQTLRWTGSSGNGTASYQLQITQE